MIELAGVLLGAVAAFVAIVAIIIDTWRLCK
jgi:hypothetical protein